LAFAVFLFLPFADQIIGRYYFDHLCETEGGLHVYQTVELGPKFYHEDGSPRFMDSKGRFDGSIFNGRYEFRRQTKNYHSNIVLIESDIQSIIDTHTGKLLATFNRFIYRGGWLNEYFSYHRGGIGCRSYEGGYYNGFIRHVLKAKSNIGQAQQ
jgi:hypothetical protein